MLNYKGVLDGVPAFLGYSFEVLFTFSITIKERPDSPSSNFMVSVIFPPKIEIAFFELLTSSSHSPDLYETNLPPIFTNGRQYSIKVERFSTALDTDKS